MLQRFFSSKCMIDLAYLSTVIFAVSIISSCGSDENPGGGGGNGERGGTNVKPLQGGQLGDNTLSNDQLHKVITLTTPTSANDFSFDDAYLTNDDSPIASFVIIGVTNTSSSTTHCTTTMSGGVIRDSMGNTVPTSIDIGVLLLGSSRLLGSNQFVSGCLGPGESGYFVGALLGDVYASVVSIQFSVMTSIANGSLPVDFSLPQDNFVAQSYSVVGTRPQQVFITVRNTGSATGRAITSNDYILLDTQGNALGLESGRLQDTVLSPNQSTILEDDLLYFSGSSNEIVVYIEHAGFNNLSALTRTDYSSETEYQAYNLEQRILNAIQEGNRLNRSLSIE